MTPEARIKEIRSFGTSNLVKADNFGLALGVSTNLSAAVAAAGTALTVLSNAGFAANDYVILGKIGDETSEIRKISTVSGATTINVDACSFAHGIDTPVTFIPYNQIRFQSSATIDGTYSTLATSDITINKQTSDYYDAAGGSTTYYKVAFYNATSTELSDYSAALVATSYSLTTLGSMTARVRSLFNDQSQDFITDEEIRVWLNEAQTDIANRTNTWPFVTADTTANLTSSTYSYSLPSGTKKIKAISVLSGTDEVPLRYITERQWRDLREDVTTTDVPDYWTVWEEKIYLYPTPSTSVTNGLIISYIKDTTELSEPTDTTSINQPKVLVDYAIAQGYKKRGDFAAAGVYDGSYERGVQNLMASFAEKSGDAPAFQPVTPRVKDYLDSY